LTGKRGEAKSKLLCVANTAFFIHNYLLGVIKTFKEEGFEVVLAAPEDEYSKALEGEGFRCIPVRQLDRKGANGFKDLKLMAELLGIYRRERPDIALHYTIKLNVYGTFAARLAGAHSVCTVTGLGWLFTEKTLVTMVGGFLYKILYKIAFSMAFSVVFQNSDDRDFFIRNRLVTEVKAFLTPGPGVDTDHFSPVFCQSQDKGQASDRVVFLLLARILWDKGIGEFVEAARVVRQNHPNAEFWLVGPLDTENRAAISADVIRGWTEEGLIRYFGPTRDAREYYCQCDVAVLPSYREGTASSLIEAMAVGKPVITTDAIGCRDVVEDHKNGFLVPLKDSKALAAAMMAYIALSREEKQNMGKYSREKALRDFDKRMVIDIYSKIIDHVLGLRNEANL
jgi:glycosyltransferase involved in cell wall biosynthesis